MRRAFLVSISMLLLTACGACAFAPQEIRSDQHPRFVDCSKGDAMTTVPSCRSIARQAVEWGSR